MRFLWVLTKIQRILCIHFFLEYESTYALLAFSKKINCLVKSGSWGPKTSKSIRMQDSLNYNISQMSWNLKFNFRMWLDIHKRNKFTQSFQVGVVRHAWGCPKLCQIVSQLHLKNELRCELCFWHFGRDP